MFTKSYLILHRDEDGTISILSVFAVLLLTMLLGMVMNVGRQVDGKIRMQNAADAAAYSGGVVLARGMNTLAFTNHLLCDVFAVTAFLREARDRNAESYVPPILAAWAKEGPVFAGSSFPKFQALGAAITQKVPLEQELVRAYSEWAAAVSDVVLPLMEEILVAGVDSAISAGGGGGVSRHRPGGGDGSGAAQRPARLRPRRHARRLVADLRPAGRRRRRTGRSHAAGGRSRTGHDAEPVAVRGRRPRAARRCCRQQYLDDWNNQTLAFFDRDGEDEPVRRAVAEFHLRLLAPVARRGVPEPEPAVRDPHRGGRSASTATRHLEQYFTFLGVVYWKKVPEFAPKVFQNPDRERCRGLRRGAGVHSAAAAGVACISPGGGGVRRRRRSAACPASSPRCPTRTRPSPASRWRCGRVDRWVVGREGVPADWTLLNQRWTCQLVPATQPALAAILQTRAVAAGLRRRELRAAESGKSEYAKISRGLVRIRSVRQS